MTPGARINAAIEILNLMRRQKRPISLVLKEWANGNRYAGSSDRAAISQLIYDCLRNLSALQMAADSEKPKDLIPLTCHLIWQDPIEKLAEYCDGENYNFGPLTQAQKTLMQRASLHYAEAIRDRMPPYNPDTCKWVNVPDLIWPDFERQFGEFAMDEGLAHCGHAPIDLRVNPLQTDRDNLQKKLAAFSPKKLDFVELGLRIDAPETGQRAAPVERELAYAQGHFEVQDFGSQLVSRLALAHRPVTILDYCAGAGGKSLAIAAASPENVKIYAYDADAQRLGRSVARIRRAGITNIHLIDPNAVSELQNLQGKMDLVLVDAPCTGSGTWRRRPDQKWRLTKALIDRRRREQQEILAQASGYVRAGGQLAYVTCSLLEAENQSQLLHFLSHHPGFRVEPMTQLIHQSFPDNATELLSRSYPAGDGRLFTPYRTGGDGFFIGMLVKESA